MIDLYSDTKTKPTRPMLDTMIAAEVGDSQLGQDPAVNALCKRVADLMGMEQAIFLPSGTMCNQIAIRIHANAGDEVLCHETAHIIHSEAGGIGGLTGANTRGLGGARGQFAPEALAKLMRPGSQYAPKSAVVVVEQTSNFGGGSIWPLERIEKISALTKSAGAALHMDGARLLNAVVASGVSAADYCKPFDSAWIDFTKALGAPLGAVLVGSQGFIEEAKRWRQMFGGALRQAGVCAAACDYALDHNVERLAEDHAAATYLAERISNMPGLALDEMPETNIVLFKANGALQPTQVIEAAKEAGVSIGYMAPVSRLRLIPHINYGMTDFKKAADALENAMAKLVKNNA